MQHKNNCIHTRHILMINSSMSIDDDDERSYSSALLGPSRDVVYLVAWVTAGYIWPAFLKFCLPADFLGQQHVLQYDVVNTEVDFERYFQLAFRLTPA